MVKKVEATRVFNASLEEVWNIWVDPELVKQWWGPDHFTCPVAIIDFKVGGVSVVGMKAPESFGGQTHYNIWHYTKIVYLETIEFVMNLADIDGNRKEPVEVGMPDYFPTDVKTVVSFKSISADETEMTVVEYADFGQMSHFAKLGLEQTVEKARRLFR